MGRARRAGSGTSTARSTAAGFGHGGRRVGAGRKPNGRRAGVSHLRRPELSWTRPAHVTVRVRREVPNLRTRRVLRRVWACFYACAAVPGFRVVEYSVQGNHIHLLVEAKSAKALARGMQGFSIRLARSLNKMMGRRGHSVFADRYHCQPIKTALQARNAMRYVLNNRRRHMRQFGKLAGPSFVDPYSSAWSSGAYAVALDPAFSPRAQLGAEFAGPPPIAKARSWLLRSAWKRLGYLMIDEPPAPDVLH